jgi:CheY-like chemotaxis protein
MAPSPAHASRSAGKGRILIVDDEEGMRALLKAILEGDYQVAEADSGAALHKALDGEQPDVGSWT